MMLIISVLFVIQRILTRFEDENVCLSICVDILGKEYVSMWVFSLQNFKIKLEADSSLKGTYFFFSMTSFLLISHLLFSLFIILSDYFLLSKWQRVEENNILALMQQKNLEILFVKNVVQNFLSTISSFFTILLPNHSTESSYYSSAISSQQTVTQQ